MINASSLVLISILSSLIFLLSSYVKLHKFPNNCAASFLINSLQSNVQRVWLSLRWEHGGISKTYWQLTTVFQFRLPKHSILNTCYRFITGVGFHVHISISILLVSISFAKLCERELTSIYICYWLFFVSDCQSTVLKEARTHRLRAVLLGDEKEECHLWIVQVLL